MDGWTRGREGPGVGEEAEPRGRIGLGASRDRKGVPPRGCRVLLCRTSAPGDDGCADLAFRFLAPLDVGPLPSQSPCLLDFKALRLPSNSWSLLCWKHQNLSSSLSSAPCSFTPCPPISFCKHERIRLMPPPPRPHLPCPQAAPALSLRLWLSSCPTTRQPAGSMDWGPHDQPSGLASAPKLRILEQVALHSQVP